MLQLLNYINGELISPVSQSFLDNYNPANGAVYSQLPDSDAQDVELAFQAAKNAFPAWKNTSTEERFKLLNKIAELIDANNDELAKAESIDQGKPFWLAKNEMIRSAQNFRFFATAAMQFSSESHHMEGHAINYTLRQSLRVVG